MQELLKCENEKEYRTNERLQASPCVWILQPIEWNMKALELLIQNTALIDECIDRLDGITFADKVEIKDRIQYLEKNLDDYMETKSAKHLKGIFNLSDIVGNIQAMDRSELRYHLTRGAAVSDHRILSQCEDSGTKRSICYFSIL